MGKKEFNSLNASTYKQESKSKINNKIDIEVGDEKQNEFYPRVKFKYFDNECNCSFGIIDEINHNNYKSGDIISWSGNNISSKFYSHSSTPSIYLDRFERYNTIPNMSGAFEFEIKLDEPPENGIVPLSINTKNVDFYYQPFLTNEERMIKTDYRPKCVEGSYAVYNSSKINNKYGTGKVCHIYRPIVTDINENSSYCNLEISSNYLNIILPSLYLDSEVYPVTIDPTFGHTGIGESYVRVGQHLQDTYEAIGSIFRPSGLTTGTAQWIHWYIDFYNNLHDQRIAGIFDYSTSAQICFVNSSNINIEGKVEESKYWLSGMFSSGNLTDKQYAIVMFSLGSPK